MTGEIYHPEGQVRPSGINREPQNKTPSTLPNHILCNDSGVLSFIKRFRVNDCGFDCGGRRILRLASCCKREQASQEKQSQQFVFCNVVAAALQLQWSRQRLKRLMGQKVVTEPSSHFFSDFRDAGLCWAGSMLIGRAESSHSVKGN